jgi:hypothetical protein
LGLLLNLLNLLTNPAFDANVTDENELSDEIMMGK